jgi:hypothetical protein
MPQALHIISPLSRSLRHSGVVLVPQFAHVWPGLPLAGLAGALAAAAGAGCCAGAGCLGECLAAWGTCGCLWCVVGGSAYTRTTPHDSPVTGSVMRAFLSDLSPSTAPAPPTHRGARHCRTTPRQAPNSAAGDACVPVRRNWSNSPPPRGLKDTYVYARVQQWVLCTLQLKQTLQQ